MIPVPPPMMIHVNASKWQVCQDSLPKSRSVCFEWWVQPPSVFLLHPRAPPHTYTTVTQMFVSVMSYGHCDVIDPQRTSLLLLLPLGSRLQGHITVATKAVCANESSTSALRLRHAGAIMQNGGTNRFLETLEKSQVSEGKKVEEPGHLALLLFVGGHV